MVEHAPRGDAVNTVVTFSSLPPSDQFDAWHDAVSKAFVPLDATSQTDGAFGGVLANRAVGPVQISDVAGGAVDVYRSARAIRRFDPGYLKLGMQLRGYCLVTQDDREAPLTPGDFALYDTRRPYQLSFNSEFRMLVVMFPHELLNLRSDDLAKVTARRVSGRRGVGGLVSPFLLKLANELRSDQIAPTFELSNAVLDLLAAAFSEQLECESSVRPETRRHALILQIKAFIDARLDDPELTTATIAAAHYISPRYLQKLFEAEGSTVTDWIRRRRLDHCKRELLDPAMPASPSAGSLPAGVWRTRRTFPGSSARPTACHRWSSGRKRSPWPDRLAGHASREHPQQAGAGVAAEVLEVLIIRCGDGDLVVKTQPGGRTHGGEVLHRLPEDGLVRGVILRPAVEVGEAAPPAHAEALVDGFTPVVDYPHVAVRVTADRSAFVPQEIHAGPQYRFDLVEVHTAFAAVGVAPVLAGTDQAEVVLAADHLPHAVAGNRGGIPRCQRVGLGERQTVAGAAPVRVLGHLPAEGSGEMGDAFEPVVREQRLEPGCRRPHRLQEESRVAGRVLIAEPHVPGVG